MPTTAEAGVQIPVDRGDAAAVLVIPTSWLGSSVIQICPPGEASH